jgi:hypothetical protein
MAEPRPCLDWSLEEAWEANKAAIDAGRARSDPSLPFSQWVALRENEADRIAYEKTGNGFFVMRALSRCCRVGIVSPDWLATAYLKAFDDVLNYRVRTWDEALGPPVPKGAHLADLRRRRHDKYAIYSRVRREHEEAWAPIDEALFERVGAEFGLGKTAASELYRSAKRELERKTFYDGLLDQS